MAFGDQDLPVFFADFGVPVAWNGGTLSGVIDVYSDVFHHGDGPGSFEKVEYILHIPQPANGGPKPFDTISIADNGNLPPGFVAGDYTVKSFVPCHDPSLMDIILKGPITS